MAESEQSITTYVARRAMQEAEHPEYKPDLGDILYATHGTGSDRDRFYTLQEIAEKIAGGSGITELEIRKALVGGGNKIVHIDGESVEISQYGGSNPDNSTLHADMHGITIVKSTSEPARTYTVEIDKEGVSVTDSNPGGTFTAELKGGVVRLKRGNDGVEVSYDKVSTPNLFLTFDAKGRSSTGLDEIFGMSAFENTGTGLPTLYFCAQKRSSQQARDYFVLDSSAHTEGAVVMIKNVDDEYPITLFRESDTNFDYPLCDIAPHSTKCVVYQGVVATGTGTGVTHVWNVM